MGLVAQCTWAEDPPTALSFAIFRKVMKVDLPIEALAIYAMPFRRDEVIEKKVGEVVGHLKKLGMQTLGDFNKLSSPSLMARFGAIGWLLFQNVQMDAKFVWPIFRPQEHVSESLEFDLEYPIETIEPILFSLKSLIEKIYLRLRTRGERMKTLLLKMDLEHPDSLGSRVYEFSVPLANGILSAQTIFGIIRERMQQEVQHRPLPQRVTAFHLIVSETTPYRISQRDIFSPKRQEEEEEYTSLVTRLKVRLGSAAVFSATPVQSFVPEYNWRKSSQALLPAEGKNIDKKNVDIVPQRPLRVFKTPLKMSDMDMDQIHLFDKEVLFSEWWNEVPERIYFRANHRNGQELWLYRSKDGVFVHGTFD
jgi:hypothetical protein